MGWSLIGNEKGVTVVELAIIFPIFLVVLFGIIEFALILYDKAVITHASREGARAGIVFRADPDTVDFKYKPMSEPDIEAVVNQTIIKLVTFSTDMAVTTVSRDPATVCSPPPDPLPPTTQCPPLWCLPRQITVTVTYPYTFLVLPNLVTDLVGLNPLNLSAVTIMRCEGYL